MNKGFKIALFVAAMAIGSYGLQSAFAQEEIPTESINIIGMGVALVSFIVAGVFYSSSGYVKKVRRKLAGEDVHLDYAKMGKTVGIGVILGVAAMIWSTYNGDTIAINNIEEFLAQVGLNASVILIVDKWILGRADTVTSKPGI